MEISEKEKYHRKTPEFKARRNAARRELYRKNPEKHKLQNYAWRVKNPRAWKDLKRRSYEKNKLRIIAKVKAWYHKNRKRCVRLSRFRYLKREYGLSKEDYLLLLKTHKGRCGICKKLFKSKTDRHTDHCHKTNKVRGLLCTGCNMALGSVEKHDWAWLPKALLYLKKHG